MSFEQRVKDETILLRSYLGTWEHPLKNRSRYKLSLATDNVKPFKITLTPSKSFVLPTTLFNSNKEFTEMVASLQNLGFKQTRVEYPELAGLFRNGEPITDKMIREDNFLAETESIKPLNPIDALLNSL